MRELRESAHANILFSPGTISCARLVLAKGHKKRPANGEGKTMWTVLALLVAFLAVVILIIRGQSPIIMLLILAVLWAAIAGIGIEDIQKKIIQAGGVQYASAVIIIVFGAWFAQVLIQTGIAESVIRSAVELAGDRPMVTAMTITLVTALLFTSMYGVGAALAIA